jgi:2-polyprenyl-3-methyl-5-hydroxy-6-metoxy-1,4-benzoquinol methylase
MSSAEQSSIAFKVPNIVTDEIVENYNRNYGFTDKNQVSKEMIALHFETEMGYRERLLGTTPEERTAIFEQCYGELYGKFSWLNHSQNHEDRVLDYVAWGQVIGPKSKSIYEIGSGDAGLARYLAGLGHTVTATEITSERGKVFASDIPNVTWAGTDGVHLANFAPQGAFDVVVSNQVIEHLHPEDAPAHFRNACLLLKPGGSYMLSTPHAHVGPSDVGRVMGVDMLVGMHLKEYTYAEVEELALQAGFAQAKAILRIPRGVRKILRGVNTTFTSTAYMGYLKMIEKQIEQLPSQAQRRNASHQLKVALFSDNLFVMLEKAR